MKRDWLVDLVVRLPQGTLSRAWGWLARREKPRPGVDLLKRMFVAAASIDLSEATQSLSAYPTLEDLFVRRLRAGARPIAADPQAVVSPVDGTVGTCGSVRAGTLLQVKGREYTLARLLDDDDSARRFEGGPYATFYLSPRNYHRIHAPFGGAISEATLIPGRLLPVFAESVQKIDELFARNERLVSYIDTSGAGRLAVIKVGATMVGRITVGYDPHLVTNRKSEGRRHQRYDPPRPITKGAELGAFELGSTVVLVGEAGRLTLEGIEEGRLVKMGQRIGTAR